MPKENNQGSGVQSNAGAGAGLAAAQAPVDLGPGKSATQQFIEAHAPIVLPANIQPSGQAAPGQEGAAGPTGGAANQAAGGEGQMLLNRYDMSTPEGAQQADAFVRQQQSAAATAQNLLQRYAKYDPLIEEIEHNPAVTKGVIGVLKGAREGTLGDDSSGSAQVQAPELIVEVAKDEYGQPTGEAKVDPESLKAYTEHVASQAANRAVSSALSSHEKKNSMRQGIEHFTGAHPEVSKEQVDGMLAEMRALPPEQMLERLYGGYKAHLGGQSAELAAEHRGQDMVYDQVERAQQLGPTLATQAGGQQRRPNIAEQMLTELLEADQADAPTGLFE